MTNVCLLFSQKLVFLHICSVALSSKEFDNVWTDFQHFDISAKLKLLWEAGREAPVKVSVDVIIRWRGEGDLKIHQILLKSLSMSSPSNIFEAINLRTSVLAAHIACWLATRTRNSRQAGAWLKFHISHLVVCKFEEKGVQNIFISKKSYTLKTFVDS